MKNKYTNEKNVQMLISILKHNNIKKVIASPGTTNIAFVASIQNDPFFEIYSCVDERSACYMACGLAVEANEPVVLTCTGATASRNYMPGLTEAFYRKIPILAVTSAQHFSKIGNNVPQSIDRTSQLNDTFNLSVQIPIVNNGLDEQGCNLLLNKAVLELKRNGGGPVHINIVTSGSVVFDTTELPHTRFIDRVSFEDSLPVLKKDEKIGIFIGSHKRWDDELTEIVDKFCAKYNAVVLCDHTSNYYGKYKILANIICDQDKYSSSLNDFDVLIHIGDISGAYLKINTKSVWRVNSDGEIRDTFSKLKYVFDMSEKAFFKKYVGDYIEGGNNINYMLWKKELIELENEALSCDIPFSNLYVARNIIQSIPDKSTVHLAILNTLRSWNYFDSDKKIEFYTNTGGFGIDGALSTLIGASLANPNKIYYGFVGDLAFFYDINSLCNRNLKNNLRIMLINNASGTEFHNYSHPASLLGDMAGKFIAADGHNGNKSTTLVKNFANDLGFEYLSASNKEEFIKNVDYFTSNEMYEKPLIFEIFTNSYDESEALKTIRSLKSSLSGNLKNTAKNLLSPKTKSKIKKIIKRG